MWKDLVSWVSMALPCWTEKVWSWARMVLKMIVQAKIGTTEIRVFTCSTWVTVQRLQGLSFVVVAPSWTSMQALSRNLKLDSMPFLGFMYWMKCNN